MTKEGRFINIFWTGGLDSTFRIVELSRCQCTIQPYYVVIGRRKSFHYELNAIDKISRILRKDGRTQANLLDPIIVYEHELSRDSKIFDSWYCLMNGKSWQYYVLAKYVNLLNVEMEMGIQFSPNGTVARAIDETLLVPHPDPDYDVQVIDKVRAAQDTLTVFGGFCFPKSLFHKSKKEEIEILRQEGWQRAALVCERHTGTGLSRKQIENQGLPLPLDRSYEPEALEEQVVCYADKFYSKTHIDHERTVVETAQSLEKFGAEGVQKFLKWVDMFE